MNKNAVLALAAGLLGGVLAHYVAPPSVFAQAPAPSNPKEIRAQSFTLVDQSNDPVGTFTAETSGKGWSRVVRIVLRDSSGHEIWSAGGSAVRPVTAK